MSHDTDTTEVLATIEATPARRIMGVAMLVGLGLMTLYVAAATPPELAWQLFLLVVAAGALWMGYRMWIATAHRVELTEEVLRCSDGTIIAKVADLQHVDRGFFAFKPSNGFLLRSRVRRGRSWYPGLWWSLGRQIGIGGMTPGHQSKTMSEVIAVMLQQRKQG